MALTQANRTRPRNRRAHPDRPTATERPVDVFFPAGERRGEGLLAVPGARLANLSPERHRPEPAAAAHEFARRSSTSSSSRSASSACSSRSSCARARAPPRASRSTSSSWASAACARRSSPALDTIPAVVKNTADEAMLRDALLENLHRADLNPLEEASAYQQLLAGLRDHPGAARRADRPVASADHQHHPPAPLPESIQRRVAAGVLTRRARAARSCRSGRRSDGAARRQDRQRRPLGARRRGRGRRSRRPRRRAAKPSAGKRQGQLDEIAERLGDRLDTRVKIALGREQGHDRRSSSRPSATSTGSCGSWASPGSSSRAPLLAA